MENPEGRRILFVAENVTTDQVTRLVTLARSLPEASYEVVFASSELEEGWFAGSRARTRRIYSLPREQILRAVAAGKQAYDEAALRRYLDEDRRLLSDVRPDLVVANFRPSLTVSGPLQGVGVVSVVSAAWSPFAVHDAFPVPDHPTVKMVGLDLARRFLPKALPAALALFARPINELRKRHGLPALGDLRKVMNWGKLTLHQDIPELGPTRAAPSTHHYLGRVRWSPAGSLPAWWDELPRDRPTVYLTLGSSGNLQAWPALRQGLSELPVNVMLATAGRLDAGRLPANFWSAELLPGELAARRAALAITNGGSGSSYQALAEGTPVLGVASNLDQHLCMAGVERAGAGRVLRAGDLTAVQVRAAVSEALGATSLAEASRRLSRQLADWDAEARFVALVDQVTRTPTTRDQA